MASAEDVAREMVHSWALLCPMVKVYSAVRWVVENTVNDTPAAPGGQGKCGRQVKDRGGYWGALLARGLREALGKW